MKITDLELPRPVLILEDDLLMQQRLKTILINIGYQYEELLLADTLQDALKILELHSISFALVDLGLPDGNGKTLITNLNQRNSDSLILVISAWSTQETFIGAIQAGATGFMLKERDDFEMTLSIKSLLRGGAPIDPFVAKQILNQFIQPVESTTQPNNENNLLSPRELEVLKLVEQGFNNKEIAEQINLSRYTVECHIKHIYQKLSVSNRTKAINTARYLGLLS